MSMVFTPFYLPIVGLIALFIFSYMSLLPMTYKLVMLAMVYLLTVVAPSLLIHLYRLCQAGPPTSWERRSAASFPTSSPSCAISSASSGWSIATRRASSASS